jgi:ATP phosphoribosyltransferase regulatory subunit
VGVELFGEATLAADIEVIELFLQTLKTSGVNDVHLDLGHVDIFRGLLASADLTSDQETELFELLQRKASGELSQWVDANIGDSQLAGWLNALPGLAGSSELLEKAKAALAGAPAVVTEAIAQLENIIAALENAGVSIYLDLGEMPGYHYHTGVVFAAYVQGYGKALGNGGRYDHVGEAFGRSRPATGFACDLKSLVTQGQGSRDNLGGIFVPASNDPECQRQVTLLRSQGNRVVQGFAEQDVDFNEINCDRQLVKQDGQYVINKLS